MSLSEFVERDDVKPLIDETFPNAGERVEESVKVGWQTTNYYLVGRAFDYILGTHLEREATKSYVRQWGPREGVDVVREQHPEDIDAAVDALRNAIDRRKEYLNGGQLSREFITAMFDLARLEGISRDALDPVGFGSAADDDVVDCIRLLKTASDAGLDEVDSLFVRPAFGLASRLVDGAEADYILDDTLVTTKVTKQPTFKVGYWRKLVGYLTLADLHATLLQHDAYTSAAVAPDADISPAADIERFGVYFARHGVLKTVDAACVYDDPDYPAFKSEFVDAALRNTADWDDGDIDSVLRAAATPADA